MTRRATVEDIHATARGMPHVTVFRPESNPVYQVGSRSSVLLRAPRLGELGRDELVEIVEEAWFAQASDRRGRAWLHERGLRAQDAVRRLVP